MKRILAALLIVLLVVSVTACGKSGSNSDTKTDTQSTADQQNSVVSSTPDEKNADGESVFTTDKLDITLPEGYHLSNNLIPEGSDVDMIITDAQDNVGLMFIEEPLTNFAGSEISSIDDYLSWQHDNVPGTNVSEITEADGTKSFTYTFLNTDLGYTYKYYTTAKASDTAYWTIQGFCLESQYDANKANFIRWINSIKFN